MPAPEVKERERGFVPGVVQIAGQSSLAQEFITVGLTFAEALGRCVLRDERQKNGIIIYKAQLEMFDMTKEIEDLTNWLNASAAVGGFNRALAAMTDTDVFVPQGAGIRLSKEDQKELREVQKQRDMRNRGNDDRNTYSNNHRE